MLKSVTSISLFCGCGGFDLGMALHGVECIAAFDINKLAVSVYNKNLPPVAIAQDLSQPFEFNGPSPDIVLSGAPCQGFSTAGKRNLCDPRNKLFLKAVDIAIKMKTKVFIAENVSGILAGKHKSEYMDVAISMLQEVGYTTALKLIDCRGLGMAQMRKRALLFAWITKKEIPPPKLDEKPKTMRDVIYNIPSTASNHDIAGCTPSGTQLEIAMHIKPGKKLSNVRKGARSVHTWQIPKVYGQTTDKEKEVLEAILRVRRQRRERDWGDADPVSPANLEAFLGYNPVNEINSLKLKRYIKAVGESKIDLTNTFNGKYRRLCWDDQSLTVDTRFGSPILFLHPEENRAYTVREAARLQGFPDSFTFEGSLASQYEMVGNAVPPPLGAYAAQIAIELLNE